MVTGQKNLKANEIFNWIRGLPKRTAMLLICYKQCANPAVVFLHNTIAEWNMNFLQPFDRNETCPKWRTFKWIFSMDTLFPRGDHFLISAFEFGVFALMVFLF